MSYSKKTVICYASAASADWGGASRVLFTNIKLLNKDKYEPIVLLPKKGPIIDELERIGVRYEIWGKLHDPKNPVQYIRDIYKAYRFFTINHVDILHMNNQYWRPAEILAAKLSNIPILSHYHTIPEKPGPFVRYSTAIITVSDYVSRNSRPRNVRKITVYNSVDSEKYLHAKDIRGELGIRSDDIVISYVGQIKEIKGIDLFIEMAKKIDGDNLKFIIAGGIREYSMDKGGYSEERLYNEIKGDRRIVYTGYRDDIENIYKSSDIIVMPSRWEEPFGLINIEAGISGKPIVSADVGGVSEVVEHGINGYLFRRNNVSELKKYTERLIYNEDLRKNIGSMAEVLTLKRFTSATVRELEKIYDQLS